MTSQKRKADPSRDYGSKRLRINIIGGDDAQEENSISSEGQDSAESPTLWLARLFFPERPDAAEEERPPVSYIHDWIIYGSFADTEEQYVDPVEFFEGAPGKGTEYPTEISFDTPGIVVPEANTNDWPTL
ncbi:hypothetical protein TWF192_005736 [Orbilia oligospora]|uniref:Uncharacterized protein n=1 Tax=Orbilia oligospora TaxID=2813651 RepID=A0A6G1MMM8_ORBOL|nr:hypothetical protein TWF191_003903 [Orbilia oligospora]KAF3263455.1 hypothetical protein TWF192_005736 [Orbilia oligospora]